MERIRLLGKESIYSFISRELGENREPLLFTSLKFILLIGWDGETIPSAC